MSCDLLQTGDYESLKGRLRTLGAQQVLSAQWVLRSTYTAVQLKDVLRQFIADQDRILVVEVGQEWASRRAFVNLATL